MDAYEVWLPPVHDFESGDWCEMDAGDAAFYFVEGYEVRLVTKRKPVA